jgi:hypothetical protein
MIPFWHAKETQSGSSVFFSFHFLEVLTAKGYTVYKDKGNDISTGKQKITECESVVFLCLFSKLARLAALFTFSIQPIKNSLK